MCCECEEQLEAVQTYHFSSADKILKKAEEKYKKEYKRLENDKTLNNQYKINSALFEQEMYIQKKCK